ncbi:DUF2905 domain-containing protein [Thermospira aquatica]|uniref:DUF2905 domain-containing protein n=1 Tax=Thermospira aquatica TaxID=2828656 RepID=A0AAX3BF70_9SPIR|nr:DUF2905 domain-containing protein [Thermospira aquatica]URA10979.1 DUF2905 domain-containing protein [Thermospira aquatica]
MTDLARWLFLSGVFLCLLAGIVFLAGKFSLLGWFGRLPGDIHYEGQSVQIFIPWVSMLVISLVLSLLLQLISLFRR